MDYDLAVERLPEVLRRLRQPVIAMIQGHAIGAGTIIAASCDFRIAVRTAKFGIPAAKLGLFIAVPDIQRMVHLIGPAKTKWLMMTGKTVQASEAEAMGLVDEVVEASELQATVDNLAAVLASNAPLSIAATKQIVEQFAVPYSEIRSGAPWYRQIYASRDFREGVEAFLQKRKAEFTGA